MIKLVAQINKNIFSYSSEDKKSQMSLESESRSVVLR